MGSGCQGHHKRATVQKSTRQWKGWSDQIAHPDSPLGAGGLGYFATNDGGFGTPGSGEALPNTERPGPLGDTPQPAPTATLKPKPPPATNARTLATSMEVQTDFVDIKIDAKVLSDQKNQDVVVAVTEFELPTAGSAAFIKDPANAGKIKATSKLTWRGTITIRTRYQEGVKPDELTCYGRGTTTDDVKNGDVTIGFHESCHQTHFANYLSTHALPAAPDITADMSLTDAAALAQKFVDATVKYSNDAKADTVKHVDEVGVKMSSGKCYNWPPLEEEEEEGT